MLNLDFLEKDLGIVSPPHFVYDFSRKKCLMLYLTDPISLPNCLCFLRYQVKCVLQLFVNQVVTS